MPGSLKNSALFFFFLGKDLLTLELDGGSPPPHFQGDSTRALPRELRRAEPQPFCAGVLEADWERARTFFLS